MKTVWVQRAARAGMPVFLGMLLLAGGKAALEPPSSDEKVEALERLGAWNGPDEAPLPKPFSGKRASVFRNGGFLLVPESTNDTVGMYDPYDGTHIGDLIANFPDFATPLNAVLGPDGNLYVSDQVADAVFVFGQAGNYLFTYADASDGLDNIRGIDFRDGHLFVTSGDDYVAEFDGPHSRLPDFINDGSDPFDILFLTDGSCLLTDVGAANSVKRYDASGIFVKEIFKVEFPEQVQSDPVLPGAFLNAAFTDRVLTDFDTDGNIHQTTPLQVSCRGVHRLGNGNLLVASAEGVQEVEPVTGLVIDIENTGSARYIERIELDALAADQTEILENNGGVVHFLLNADPTNGGRNYILLGSVSGTSPGVPLPGGLAVLPINWDLFTGIMIGFLNTPLFQDFMGTLDAHGRGAATFDTLGPITGAAGITLSFAFALNNPFDFASNAVSVEVLP